MSENHAAKTWGIKAGDKFGYALGDGAGTLIFACIGSYLQMFYTDVLLISAGKIATLFVVARIWDAINDPIWGSIIDSAKPDKKGGRYLRYLKWLSLPLALAGIAMFFPVNNFFPNISESGCLIYAYITYILYGMLYTTVNIPYGSLASVITSDENERSVLSTFRSVGSTVGGIPSAVLLPMIIYTTMLDGSRVLDGNKLLQAVACLAGCSLICYFIASRMMKERVPAQPVQKGGNVFKTVGRLFTNGSFIVLCIASMMLIASQMYTQTMYNYLCKNYFEKPGWYTFVMVCSYLPVAILMFFLPKLCRKFGKKEICAFGALISAAANLVMWLLHSDNIFIFLILCFISGFGITFFSMQVWAMVTDVIDFHEYKHKKREEGTSYALFSFTRKLGQAAAGYCSAIALAIIGYNALTISEQPEVVDKMFNAATLIPVFMYLLIFILLALCYPLSKKRLAALQPEYAAMRDSIEAEEIALEAAKAEAETAAEAEAAE